MRQAMSNQFDFVSVVKKPTVHYGGRSVSHVLKMEDGSQKTIGVFLLSEQPMTFEAHVKERVEITSGQCVVQIGEQGEFVQYTSGESFIVPQDSIFKVQCTDVVDYVCHFD